MHGKGEKNTMEIVAYTIVILIGVEMEIQIKLDYIDELMK